MPFGQKSRGLVYCCPLGLRESNGNVVVLWYRMPSLVEEAWAEHIENQAIQACNHTRLTPQELNTFLLAQRLAGE